MDKARELRAKLREHHLDAALLTSVENMQWYTGFSGDTGWVLVTPEKEYFITDFRYIEMAERELEPGRFEMIKERTGGVIPGMELWLSKGARLGIEFDKITVSEKQAFDAAWS